MDKTSTGYQFSHQHTQISCEYTNWTDSVQVIRISNIDGWYFERTVFPGQRTIFETVTQAVLEVNTGNMMTAVVSDRIPCLRLRAAEPIQCSVKSALKSAAKLTERSAEDSVKERYASSVWK